jgi:hypothetical protein
LVSALEQQKPRTPATEEISKTSFGIFGRASGFLVFLDSVAVALENVFFFALPSGVVCMPRPRTFRVTDFIARFAS